MIAFPEIARSD